MDTTITSEVAAAARAKRFFEMLAAHGVETCIMLAPPEGGDVAARIEADGSLTTKDLRDGRRKKIRPGFMRHG